MKNPFDGFYHVPSSKELLDIAFKRAMKSSAQVSKNAPIIIKAKKKESKRIKVAIEQLINRILRIIKMVPIIDDLPDFYKELASILVDIDKLKLTLGKLNGILPILSQIGREHRSNLKRIDAPKEGDRLRRAAFGRVSSIINKQNKNLKYLNEIRGRLREIPSINYTMPCVVVAGYPNVGKSSIVKNISTNKKIEVQEYPFTTKKLNMGHLELERRFDKIRIQCLDTPGILDRPMAKRNNIELQAILALRLISDLILFIFDPTPASGYNVESQIELYNEIKQNFSKERHIEIVVVFNKMDLAKDSEIRYLKDTLNLKDDEFYLTNALTGENLDKLITDLKKRYERDE
ncbi:MAG: GTP-binding protein [Promethearchaeota archaeon]|nr:50S ribosome-binding GTPase [Candidatus Lokiarchaeota archaeon]MCK4480728.1 50S ribosome-binding GTPase [Candidatus Lokiarchaeota archaeon]TET56620.1 MAG: GTP-binding protein [Candidatus Lokiarchaeota archaeon]